MDWLLVFAAAGLIRLRSVVGGAPPVALGVVPANEPA
jgi:hypothetical protein